MWVTVDQEMIDGFVTLTGDDAFIHSDPSRAAQTRFKGTIAHGLLILSLLPWLMRSAVPEISDRRMGVNCGFDRVRYIAPVPCGSRVRAQFALKSIEGVGEDFFRLHYGIEVEIDGVDKPALVARWIIGCWVTGNG